MKIISFVRPDSLVQFSPRRTPVSQKRKSMLKDSGIRQGTQPNAPKICRRICETRGHDTSDKNTEYLLRTR